MLKNAVLKTKKNLTTNVVELTLAAEGQHKYSPGQFLNLKIADGKPGMCFRPYSIASYRDGDFVLIVKIVAGGRGSEFIQSLSTGVKVEFLGPVGNFFWQNREKREEKTQTILVATGTGIVPFLAYLQESNQITTPTALFWGLRKPADIFYQNELDEHSRSIPSFHYKICLSQDYLLPHLRGRVTEQMNLISAGTDFYLCGSSAMIEEMIGKLTAAGKEKGRIRFEKFD